MINMRTTPRSAQKSVGLPFRWLAAKQYCVSVRFFCPTDPPIRTGNRLCRGSKRLQSGLVSFKNEGADVPHLAGWVGESTGPILRWVQSRRFLGRSGFQPPQVLQRLGHAQAPSWHVPSMSFKDPMAAFRKANDDMLRAEEALQS